MKRMYGRRLLVVLPRWVVVLAVTAFFLGADWCHAEDPPNILFAMADDWSWPHASAYGSKAVHTPNFDRVAANGLLFTRVFTAAPQCSPNRAALLTGRPIWQLREAGTHNSIFPAGLMVFPDLLENAGYFVGFTGKGWSPGNWELGGRTRNPAGPEFNSAELDVLPTRSVSDTDYAGNFRNFLDRRPEGTPFCFWFGGHEPHRSYEAGTGRRAGKRLKDADALPFLPDHRDVREDFLDYALEVEHFDTHVGRMLDELAKRGELENTLVIVTSDNGMPFPAAKANLYEYGTHVPFAVQWPARVEASVPTDALVSFIDIAPTLLAAADLTAPDVVVGRSFLPLLIGGGNVERRDYVLTGRERHSHSRVDNLGYPSRAIRTDTHLLIWNMRPNRWPAGDPPKYHDIDGSPTMDFLIEHRAEYPKLFALGFEKRPEFELFSVESDPGCTHNLADSPKNADMFESLKTRLQGLLREQRDPRVMGTGDVFESYPRFGGMRPELGGFAERGVYNPKYQSEDTP